MLIQDETSIDELDLTIRTANILKAENIHKIGELLFYSDNQLLKLPNLGRKSFTEIKNQLRIYEDKNLKQIFSMEVARRYIENYFVHYVNEMKKDILGNLNTNFHKVHSNINEQINEIRTLVLEQKNTLEEIELLNKSSNKLINIEQKLKTLRYDVRDLFDEAEKLNRKLMKDKKK